MIKNALCGKPVLRGLDFTQPLVQIDTSYVGLGAALMQNHEGTDTL